MLTPRNALLGAAVIFFTSMISSPTTNPPIKITYPKTKKVNQVDDYHGTKVEDPYRWLEDDMAPDVKEWVKAEQAVTENYLSQVPFRNKIKERLRTLFNYPKYGLMSKKGDYYYFTKNDGLQNLSVIYFQKGIDGTPQVFFDPNKLSKEGTVTANLGAFSNDYKHVALIVNQAGSDWQEIQVMDATTGKHTGDTLKWVKFSDAAWYKDGFYYSRYDEPKGSMLSQSNENQKVYYHKLGTPQSEDKLVFEEKQFPKRYYGAQVTDDERFLIISGAEGTDGTELWVQDLTKNEAKPQMILKGFEHNYGVIDNDGDRLLVITNDKADRQQVVSIDPTKPSAENWKVIVPEQKEAMMSVSTAGGKMFVQYLTDASSRVNVYIYDGKLERSIQLPGIGTVAGFGGSKKDKEVFYGFSSFTVPFEQYSYDIATGASKLYRKTEVPFDTKAYETVQKFFKSKDGASVPVFVTYKKGIKLDGTNPTMLYGYGGFNIPMTPGFSASNMLFLENGGVYAVANLRGGSEYGEEWHKAGMLLNKQTVFDDFIGAAEFLIKEKYTSSSKLAIYGRSNGGLLVGAVMLQRPDLFKVALPTVGVLDMLRYHKFTVGWGWAVEYGSADSSLYFPYLLKYSPLHNIKSNVEYPATMVMTADHDDRVVPAHSFKFAATLQEKYSGNRPMLIRIETQAGHGSGGAGSISKILEQETDRWAFTFYNLDMTL